MVDINKEQFSSRLKELFGKRRGAKARLARAGGVDHTVATRWYKGKTLPSLQGLAGIVKETHCNVNWLLFGEGECSGRAELVRKEMPEYPESDIKSGPFYERAPVNGYPGAWTLRPLVKLEKPPKGYKIVGVIIE